MPNKVREKGHAPRIISIAETKVKQDKNIIFTSFEPLPTNSQRYRSTNIL